MFDWLRPKQCPVDQSAKAWIEQRIRWLIEQFGEEILLDSPTVLPTAEDFPDEYRQDWPSARVLFGSVCRYMGVPPETVKLKGHSEANRPDLVNGQGQALAGTAGLYEEGSDRFVVRLNKSQLDQPMLLVGTMAHELAHVRLLGENRISPDAPDNELLTDLTTVFFGLGVFLANAPRHWDSDLGYWPGTRLRKPEYMTLPMYGYALALRAQLREESPKVLRRHLKPAARAEFDQARRYLDDELAKKQRAAEGVRDG